MLKNLFTLSNSLRALAIAAATTTSIPVHAASLFALPSAMTSQSALLSDTHCAQMQPAAFVPQKSARIYDARQPSALDRMRNQQSSEPKSSQVAQTEFRGLQPAASATVNCSSSNTFVRPRANFSNYASSANTPYDFLQSRILPVSRTSFDSDWGRVRSDRAGVASARAQLPSRGSTVDRIAAVNAFVNARVAYASDVEQYGQSDYWATAGETLRRGKGDCEDYAIAKMQILAELGIPQSAMFLTLGRDLARRDDHAVLIVKIDGKVLMLDNATDEVLDGSMNQDLSPVLSFNGSQRYLHGY